MITCKICHKFVSNVETTYRSLDNEVLMVEGDCATHGRVECDYDDYEELGIE